MKRVLLDTNIYGRLIEDRQFLVTLFSLVPDSFVVYGSSLIRKELRDVSKQVLFEGKHKRTLLLSVYDSFIKKKNHDLHITDLVVLIAHKYYDLYKNNQRVYSVEELLADFTLVALASLHGLDIVVSDDKRTMFSDKAKQAYNVVNSKYQFRTPTFYTFDSFKEYAKRIKYE